MPGNWKQEPSTVLYYNKSNTFDFQLINTDKCSRCSRLRSCNQQIFASFLWSESNYIWKKKNIQYTIKSHLGCCISANSSHQKKGSCFQLIYFFWGNDCSSIKYVFTFITVKTYFTLLGYMHIVVAYKKKKLYTHLHYEEGLVCAIKGTNDLWPCIYVPWAYIFTDIATYCITI